MQGLLKLKQLIVNSPLKQIALFLGSRIIIGMIELPHSNVQTHQLSLMIIAILLVLFSIALKIYRHKFLLVKALVKIQIQCFLLWLVAIVLMIFTWGLLSNLSWSFFQKASIVICQSMSIFFLTLMMKEDFITKMEYIFHELTLVVQIAAISLKTVDFIRYDYQSSSKDIVLLNLTTQITLIILLMEGLSKSYERKKSQQINEVLDENKKTEQLNENIPQQINPQNLKRDFM